MQSDAELIRQCQNGQRDSFRPIVERYQAEAYGHALTLLKHREDALDSIQDAFLSAFRAIDQFDVAREFYPWFYVILRNGCFKKLEARKRRTQLEADGLEQCQLISKQGPTMNESVVANDLEEALWSLSSEDREIVTLKYFEGLKYAELAERLSIPEGTVMSRLYHARQRLRELLHDSEELKPRLPQKSD